MTTVPLWVVSGSKQDNLFGGRLVCHTIIYEVLRSTSYRRNVVLPSLLLSLASQTPASVLKGRLRTYPSCVCLIHTTITWLPPRLQYNRHTLPSPHYSPSLCSSSTTIRSRSSTPGFITFNLTPLFVLLAGQHHERVFSLPNE